MNVGIIGASGIGKHHAKWFTLAGCKVTAFTGTTPERCAATAALLRDLCGFGGQTYLDYREMLEHEPLDIVCVCSPPEAHLNQIADALAAGRHVYAEKPVTWPPSDLLSCPLASCPNPRARSVFHPALHLLLEETRSALSFSGPVFGLNAQYVAAREAYRTLYEAERGALRHIESFYFLLESKGLSGRYSAFEGIWIDMAPHGLSQMIDWLPEGTLKPDTVTCDIGEETTSASFCYGDARIEMVCRKNVVSIPKRRFGVNGFWVDYEGRADENGVYRSFLTHNGKTVMIDDLMDVSVRRFLERSADRKYSRLSALSRRLRIWN